MTIKTPAGKTPAGKTPTHNRALDGPDEFGDAQPDVNTALLRRGGQAGLAGAAALVLAFLTYPIFELPDPLLVESLTDYPNIATGRVVENSFYMAALVLWAVHYLAIGRALRDPSTGTRPLAPSIAVIGLVPMIAGALLHISTAELSDLYRDPAASAADQANIVLVWQAVQSVFDTLLVTGAAIVPVAMAVVAWSLHRAEAIGRISGLFAVGLGVVGSIGGAAAVIGGPSSPGVIASVLSMIVFHVVVGWRLVRV